MSELKEYIFAHAVALFQAGRLRSTIHVKDRVVYIMNFDHTVLLRFELPEREPAFKGQIDFEADDYDSEKFYEENGRIVFVLEAGDYVRKKSCSSPGLKFQDVDAIYQSLSQGTDYRGNGAAAVFLDRSVLGLLDEGLSHVEIQEANGVPVLIQRDIFTGTVYRIEKASATRGLRIGAGEQVPRGLRLGLRTPDFMGLFHFNPSLNFWVASGCPTVLVQGDRLNMQAILSCCRYDEMGEVEIIPTEPIMRGEIDHGRQEPQKQTSEPPAGGADTPRGRPAPRRRRGNPEPVDRVAQRGDDHPPKKTGNHRGGGFFQ